MTRRRTRLLAVGLALIALSGAYVAGNAGFAAADHHDVFSVHQNGQCHEVTPLGDGSQTVDSFYDYRRGSGSQYSSHGTTHLQQNQMSQLFVYRGSGGTSLVMLHDQMDGPDGGAITFHLSGLPADGNWPVVDDTYNNSDDRFQSSATGAQIDWMWSDNRTDGAAFRGLGSHNYDAVTIEPYFNGQSWAATDRDQRWPHADDTVSWQLRDADGSTVSLDRNSAVQIEPGPCQPATPTPAPTTAPTPNATPTLTPTPTPTATPTPTPNVTSTPTPTPNQTTTPPNETATPTPNGTATPTPTPEPTPEPTPDPTPTATPPPDNDDDDDGGGGGGGGSDDQNRGYDPDDSGEGSEQEQLPEMDLDVERPDDDTALVDVSNPASEENLSVEPLVSGDSVDYQSMNFSFDAAEDFEMDVRASDSTPPGVLSPSAERDGFEALSYLSVDRNGLAAENVTDSEIAFAIDESTLDEQEITPEEVGVYRQSDGEWQSVPFELVGEDDGRYEYVAKSSNASSFVVGANRSSLSVTDVTLAEETIGAGSEAEIRATVENTGNAAGTQRANLTAFGTVVDEGSVEVPAGETRTLVFTQQFNSPGEYTVAVDGIEAQLAVESATTSPTETPTPDPTSGPGQPGFGLLSALLMMAIIGLVVVYGLWDVV